MATKTEKELGETQRAHWLKAVAAIEMRNFGYAITLLLGILKQEPEFLTGRQLLRRAEITRAKAAKKNLFNISTAPLALMKAQRELRKDPRRAIALAEEVLADEPHNRQANMLLKEAASAAGFGETAVFALETILEQHPRDTKVLHELGRTCHDLGQNEREVEIYNRIVGIDPLDAVAVRMVKDASARASMKGGGWSEASSYRDLIRDKDAAVLLEQQTRMQVSDDSIDRQLAETYAAHQANPENVAMAQRLGSLNEQKDDLESAVAWYEYATQLTGGTDPGLARKTSDLRVKTIEREIALLEQGTDSVALAEAKKRRAEMLMEQIRRRVERNPTDLQLRFELGEQLVVAGNFREAVPELQRARQNPNARLRAMNLLGRCYAELGMLDLATKQFEEAAKELVAMDAMKKEIVYNLGIAYAEMGAEEKSLACMKQIYEADYGYKDVATRVESSYGQRDETR